MSESYHGSQRWQELVKFANWLYEADDVVLPESCIKFLNHKILVSMFSKNHVVNNVFQKLLNSIYLYKIPVEEFAYFVKQIVATNNIPKNSIWWFSNLDYVEVANDKETYQLHNTYEKNLLKLLIKEGQIDNNNAPDFRNQFKKEYKKKPSKIKSTKDIDKMLLDVEQELQTETDDNYKETKEDISNITLSNLKRNYSKLKTSRSSCQTCSLYNEKIVTFDSNKEDIKDIDILFVAEAPGETETKMGVPLIGKSGQLLRKYISSHCQDKNWFMSNTCLCRPPDNRKPTKQEMSNCMVMLEEIIDIVNPKLIVALGSTIMERFNIKGQITKVRGFHKYGNRDVYLTLHPSAIMRSGENYIYDEDFFNIASFGNNDNASQKVESTEEVQIIKQRINDNKNTNNGFEIKIPDEYYGYSLLDVQRVSYNNKILYIFKKPDQTKIYYESDPYFYYFVKNGIGKHVEPISETSLQRNAHQVYDGIKNGVTYYESDVPIDARHCVDYYIRKKSENNCIINTSYFDIEVLSDGRFPKEEEAMFPVTLATVANSNGERVCYALCDNHGDIIDETPIVYFKDERLLIENTIDRILKSCDVITAWNISFDIGYLYYRMKRLGMNTKLLSPLRYEPYIDLKKYVMNIPGLIVVDLMSSYELISENRKESYSLDYISEIELKEHKLEKGGKFHQVWARSIVDSIKYNIDDTKKIYKLDKKLDIIGYLNESRNESCATWSSTGAPSRLSDALLLKFARERGTCLRTRVSQKTDEKNIGAYVYDAIPGLNKECVYVVDFSKQYPSVVQTLNVGPNTLAYVFEKPEQVKDYLTVNKETKYSIISDPLYAPTTYEMTYEQVKNLITQNSLTIGFRGALFKSHKDEKSILYDLVDHLNKMRNHYKKLLAKDSENKTYDNKQRTIKELTNTASYGYLAFEAGRMNIVYLVNTITLTAKYVNKICAVCISYMLVNNKEDLTEVEFNELLLKTLTLYWDTSVKEPFIIYGDTDSIFIAIKDKVYLRWQDAKEKGDRLLSVIRNKVLGEYICKVFNIPQDISKLSLGYQGFGSSYFTDVKKKYAFNYVDGEKIGVAIKGIETRRSDTSSMTRQYMLEIIDMIIKDFKPMVEVKARAKELETIFAERILAKDLSVARPVSFSKDLKEYKSVPSTVVAMLLWNRLVGDEIFKPGTKGYSFVVKYNGQAPISVQKTISELCNAYDLKSGLNYIVIPEDFTGTIPDYVDIDLDANLDLAWRNRMRDLLIDEEDKTKLMMSDFLD